jgi:hypothetical protein
MQLYSALELMGISLKEVCAATRACIQDHKSVNRNKIEVLC